MATNKAKPVAKKKPSQPVAKKDLFRPKSSKIAQAQKANQKATKAPAKKTTEAKPKATKPVAKKTNAKKKVEPAVVKETVIVPEPVKEEKTVVLPVENKAEESIQAEPAKEPAPAVEEKIEKTPKEEQKEEAVQTEVAKKEVTPLLKRKEKVARLVTSALSLLATIVFLFVPFINDSRPIDIFKINFDALTEMSYYIIGSCALLAIVAIVSIYVFADALAHYNRKSFPEKNHSVFTLNFITALVYGIGGVVILFIDVFGSKKGYVTYSYILLIIQVLILIANSFIKSFNLPDYVISEKHYVEEEKTTYEKIKAIKHPFPSIEQFIYSFLFSLLPVGILFIGLFTVCVDGQPIADTIKGIDFLTKMGTFTNIGYKIVSFVFFIFLVADGVFLIASCATYLAKRKSFYKVSVASIIINFCFVCFVSMYGLYYRIVQASTVENIQALLEQFYPESPVIAVLTKAEVKTSSYWVAVGAAVFLIVILVRNPSRFALIYDQLEKEAIDSEELNAKIISDEPIDNSTTLNGNLQFGSNGTVGEETAPSNSEQTPLGNGVSEGGLQGGLPLMAGATGEEANDEPLDINVLKKSAEEAALETFDACPVFSELDSKANEYKRDLAKREKQLFKGTTLPSLVNFVVDYAKNSRLHLSYTKESIASFIAGLGCTRLSILQGMSGTGKTSLPKIFMEALYGNCELIEIESSWREKNELLGFYNEFSKMYTPKKFTQCLYKAALNPEIITLIVLDEMNLSRIEYYFSDFLSLMENEEDKRQIKLTNIKIYNVHDHEKHSYLKLVEDHTLKIPANVWFVGTANRDESTFEISDKVYDRAYTMNFNTRAPAIKVFDKEMDQQFLKYNVFAKMLKDAIAKYSFDIEKNKTIMEVEHLMAPFNISFGNRIYRQIENFVKVYCSCFPNPKEREFEAVETILLTKVVMKLENKNIDNRDALISEFKKLKLMRCVDFITKLSEDF